MSDQHSFTLIELLIVTPQRKLLRSFQRGKSASSFTLIELLIVIGILAILVAAVVVVLNPAQLLAQARDSKRQQDLSALNQALNTVYALDQTISFGTSSIVYTSLPDSSSTCGSWGLPTLPSGWSYHCSPTSTLQNTNGTGWIPVNFQSNGVVNLSSLPTDPVNSSSTGLYYTYVTGGSFELSALMEATKDKGIASAAGNDGGRSWNSYEIGSNLSLTPIQLLDGHSQDPSLVGWWPLNEGTGTKMYDASGNGNNATSNGTPSGSNGTYYTYDATRDEYVGAFSVSNGNSAWTPNQNGLPFGTSPRTMTIWVGGNNPVGGIFAYGTGAQYQRFFLAVNGAGAGFAMDTWFYGCNANVVLPTGGGWNLVATVFDGTTDTMYLNGVAVGSCAMPLLDTIQPTYGLAIGNRGGDYGFTGFLSDARIYNRALSASEISALYNATK